MTQETSESNERLSRILLTARTKLEYEIHKHIMKPKGMPNENKKRRDKAGRGSVKNKISLDTSIVLVQSPKASNTLLTSPFKKQYSKPTKKRLILSASIKLLKHANVSEMQVGSSQSLFSSRLLPPQPV